jgi:hypothetical protein
MSSSSTNAARENFITRFILSSMECAETRTKKAEQHVLSTFNRSKEMIERWHQPTKTVGFWKKEENQGAHVTKQEPQLRGGIGRRTNWG